MNKTRYQLTYPNIGKIHKENNARNAIKKCYRDYKNLTDIPEGIFKVANLDTGTFYLFKKDNKKVKMINKQVGGKDPYKLTLDDLKLEEINRKANEITDSKLDNSKSENFNSEISNLINLNNKVLLDEIKKLKLRIDSLEKLIKGNSSTESYNNKTIYVPKINKETKDTKEETNEEIDKETKDTNIVHRSAESVYEANRKKIKTMESIYKKTIF